MSRISASLTTPTVTSTNTTTTISVSGSLKYASGTWGWTCDGYISINSLKKSFSNVRGTTSGATFYTTSHSRTYDRGKTDKTVTITMYGYCTDSTSDTAKATKTVTVPALPSYTVTCDGVEYTKWYGEELILPTPTRDGYTFKGWTDGVVFYGTSYTENAAATLESTWESVETPPRIVQFNSQRVPDSTQVSFLINYVMGSYYIGTISIRYKRKDEANWHLLTTGSIDGGTYGWSYTGGSFDRNTTYDIQYTISAGGLDYTTLDVVTKDAYIWKALPSGLDIGVPLTVQGQTPLYSLPDYIEEETTSGNWTVIKYHSGKMVAYEEITFSSLTFTSATGGGYTNKASNSLPSGFKEAPRIYGNQNAGTGFLSTGFSSVTASSFTMNICRHFGNASVSNAKFSILAIGKWK